MKYTAATLELTEDTDGTDDGRALSITLATKSSQFWSLLTLSGRNSCLLHSKLHTAEDIYKVMKKE
jgi:hypothetical protein